MTVFVCAWESKSEREQGHVRECVHLSALKPAANVKCEYPGLPGRAWFPASSITGEASGGVRLLVTVLHFTRTLCGGTVIVSSPPINSRQKRERVPRAAGALAQVSRLNSKQVLSLVPSEQ